MRAAEEVADEARCSGGGESNRRRGRAALHRYGCLRVRARPALAEPFRMANFAQPVSSTCQATLAQRNALN